MAKEKFQRNKPHCNVGTIGHVDRSGQDGIPTSEAAPQRNSRCPGKDTGYRKG
jgi:hypothetical protein